jgi:hypothetical protein
MTGLKTRYVKGMVHPEDVMRRTSFFRSISFDMISFFMLHSLVAGLSASSRRAYNRNHPMIILKEVMSIPANQHKSIERDQYQPEAGV